MTMMPSCFRLKRVSKAGLRRSCERRPTGSSREVEENFGDLFIPALRADRRRFLSAISDVCAPIFDGRRRDKIATDCSYACWWHTQRYSGFCLAAEDKLSSLFGTGAERALRQTTAGLLLL